MTDLPVDNADPRPVSNLRRAYVLGVLSLVMTIAFIDRQILSILVEPIKKDLGVSDTQIGLLTGAAFAVFYVTAGFPLSRWADRGVRRNVIAYCCAFWSAATMFCGLGASFVHLAIARMGVAAGEAGSASIIQSLLSDLFPLKDRAKAFGVMLASASFGIAFGMFLGGWLNDLVGWRNVFIIVGTPGILIALLVRFTIQEPVRRTSRGVMETPRSTLMETFRFGWRQRSFRYTVLGLGFNSFAGYGILAWAPAFFIRVHHMSVAQVGLWMGVATAAGLVLGSLGSGALADRLGKTNAKGYLWVTAGGSLISLPLGLMSMFSPHAVGGLVLFAAFKISMGCTLPSATAVALDVVRPDMRSTAGTIISASQHVLGLALGPLVIGMIADGLAPTMGADSIRYGIGFALFALLLAGGLCLWATRTLGADMDRAAELPPPSPQSDLSYSRG